MKFSVKATILACALLVLVPVASVAAPISFTTPSVLRAGLKVVAAAITNLAPKGSYIAQGQFVCDTGSNPNCGLVSGLHAMFVPSPSVYSATGGNVKVNNAAKYESLRTVSAFSGSVAATRGLRTGSSVTLFAVLDIVKNHTGVAYDCGIKDHNGSGTGSFKSLLFDSKSATGTYVYSTPFVLGATDVGSCGTLTTPKSNSDVRLYFYSMDTFAGR